VVPAFCHRVARLEGREAQRVRELIGIAWPFPITVSLEKLSGRSLLSLLGLGVLCTAIPSFGFAIVSKRLPSTVTAATSLLIPLFAGIFAYVFLGEKLSSMMVPGGLLVLAGLVVILRQNQQSNEGRRHKINSADQQEILKTRHLRLYGLKREFHGSL
jgi:threonine/homoserine efflux transporter RhtA